MSVQLLQLQASDLEISATKRRIKAAKSVTSMASYRFDIRAKVIFCGFWWIQNKINIDCVSLWNQMLPELWFVSLCLLRKPVCEDWGSMPQKTNHFHYNNIRILRSVLLMAGCHQNLWCVFRWIRSTFSATLLKVASCQAIWNLMYKCVHFWVTVYLNLQGCVCHNDVINCWDCGDSFFANAVFGLKI